MTGTLEMHINGKLELSRSVHSWAYSERIIRDWKEKMLPVLTDADNYQIIIRTFAW